MGHESDVIEITDDTFDQVLGSDARPMLLDFTATWCGPCQHLAPGLIKFAGVHKDIVRIGSVDADLCPQLCDRFESPVLPTLVLLGADGPEMYLARSMTFDELEAVVLPYVIHAIAGIPRAPSLPSYPAGRRFVVPTDERVIVRFWAQGHHQFKVPELPGQQEVPADHFVEVAITDRTGDTEISLDMLRGGESHINRLHVVGLVGAGQLTALARFDHLTVLDLRIPTQLNTDELEVLGSMTSLRLLLIPSEVAGDNGLQQLRKALPNCVVNRQWVSPGAMTKVGPLPHRHWATEEESALTGYLRVGDGHTTFTLKIPEDGHAYGPGATDGRPLTLRSLAHNEPIALHHPDAHLVGQVEFDLGQGDFNGGVVVEAQYCTPTQCFTPETLWCYPTKPVRSPEEVTQLRADMAKWTEDRQATVKRIETTR